MNAEKYNLDRIYFGGYFIRGTSSLSATDVVHTFYVCGWRSGPRLIATIDRLHSRMRRSCGDNQHALIRYPFLEQGDEARALPATRGLPVSAVCLLPGLASSGPCLAERSLIFPCLISQCRPCPTRALAVGDAVGRLARG